MPSLLWIPEDEYREFTAKEFKKKAEAMAFPVLARGIKSLYDQGVPTRPPLGEEPPVNPPPEAPALLGYTPAGNIPSESPISAGLPEPTVSAPPMPPPETAPPDIPGFLGSAVQEFGSTLGQASTAFRGRPPGMAEQVRRFAEAPDVFGKIEALTETNLPQPVQDVMQVIPAFSGVGMVRKAGPAAKAVADVLHTDVDKFVSKFPMPEIQQTIREVMEGNPERFEAARRGVIPDEAVEEMASNLGLNAETIIKKWNPGNAENAETIQGMRAALDVKTQQVMDVAREVRDAMSKGVDPVGGKLRLQLAIAEQGALQEAVIGVRAEAGRGLRAFRSEVNDAIAKGGVDSMQDLLGKVSGKWTSKIVDEFLSLDPENLAAVYSFIRKAQQPEWWQYPMSLRYSSMLSGPRTHIVNFVSNSITTVLSPVEAGLSAAAELRAPLAGRGRERFFGEVPAMAFGMLRGFPRGLQAAAGVLKTGARAEDLAKLELRRMEVFTAGTSQLISAPAGAASGAVAGAVAPAEDMDERLRNMGIGAIAGAAFGGASPKWFSAAVNTPTRALIASDALWRNINFSSAMHAQAYREAAKSAAGIREMPGKIADILANPTKQMVDEATKTAAYRVFQAEPGEATKWLLQGRQQYPLLQFLTPFVQTPVNLVKYGAERTPLGFANVARAGSAADRSDALGRALLGSGIMAAAAMYAADGLITGPSPKDAQERAAWDATGKIPYAVKRGDTWYSYRRMEPFNLALTFAAEAVDAFRNQGKEPLPDQIMGVVKTLSDNLIGQTYLTGVFDVADLLENPDREAGEYFGKAASSFMPFGAAARTTWQMQDRTLRQPKGFEESFKAGIGMSQDIPAKLTSLGEETQFQSNPLSPYRVSQEQARPFVQEMARLEKMPGFVGSKVGGVELTREQRDKYQREAGTIMRQAIPSITQSQVYQQADDEAKGKMLQEAEDKAREAVRRYLLGEETQKESVAQIGHEIAQAVPEMAAYRQMPRYLVDVGDEEAVADALGRIRARVANYPPKLKRAQEIAFMEEWERAKTGEEQAAVEMALIVLKKQLSNPERKLFRSQHPLLQKYYSDVRLED